MTTMIILKERQRSLFIEYSKLFGYRFSCNGARVQFVYELELEQIEEILSTINLNEEDKIALSDLRVSEI